MDTLPNLPLSRRSAACVLGAVPMAFFSFLSCAAPQVAQPDARSAWTANDPGLASLMGFLDRNRDGKVEAYEGAEAMLLLNQDADANEDGTLDGNEVSAFLLERGQEQRAEVESTFAELDRDGDGVLTAEEVPTQLFPILLGADTDGNGRVSLDELLATDVLGDPLAEFEQELADFFSGVDHDRDGAFGLVDLPEAERLDFAEEFLDLDRDGDELVTREELFTLIEDEIRGATFEVDGHVAYMNGVIGPTTPGRVLELVLVHPQVETIVMLDVPGSMDDFALVRAAELVRHMGLATHMPRDGEVASGGTDFFLAGAKRTADYGARFGVHSWSGFNEAGSDLPRDHPEHRLYLDFYQAMGIGEDFYWFTLEAAPADGIHWMTDGEIEAHSLVTEGR